METSKANLTGATNSTSPTNSCYLEYLSKFRYNSPFIVLHGYSGDFGHLIRRKSARYRSEATLVIELQYDIVETKKDKTHKSQEQT
jgi:hypothetical protein